MSNNKPLYRYRIAVSDTAKLCRYSYVRHSLCCVWHSLKAVPKHSPEACVDCVDTAGCVRPAKPADSFFCPKRYLSLEDFGFFGSFCLGWGVQEMDLSFFFILWVVLDYFFVVLLWDFFDQKWPPVGGLEKPVCSLTFFGRGWNPKNPLTMLSFGALLEKCHRLRKRDIVRVFQVFIFIFLKTPPPNPAIPAILCVSELFLACDQILLGNTECGGVRRALSAIWQISFYGFCQFLPV